MDFLLKVASVANTTSVNPNDMTKILVNSSITFFINGKPTFSNDPMRLPRN